MSFGSMSAMSPTGGMPAVNKPMDGLPLPQPVKDMGNAVTTRAAQTGSNNAVSQLISGLMGKTKPPAEQTQEPQPGLEEAKAATTANAGQGNVAAMLLKMMTGGLG